MSQITAAQVKELRDKTGAGMMDAKKALVEANGDVEAAVDWLRKKGLAKAAKKSGRTAAEGLVATAVNENGTEAVVVEINSETDFVAKNEKFQTFVKKVADVALAENVETIEALSDAPYGDGKSVGETLTGLIATIGENMTLRRLDRVKVSNGHVATYIHNAVSPEMGKIASVVAIETDGDTSKIEESVRKIAMHVAAAKPEFLNRDNVDASSLEREKDVLREQAKASGKPPEIIEKMLDGRLRKYYEEVCLLEQTYIMDGESKISKVVEDLGKEAGASATLAGYINFILGDGIEKEEENFAEEVAKTVNG